MDCLPEWVDLLDQGEAAACLPYQNIINPAVVEGFTTALGVPMQPADDFYGYASPDPFGSPPICNATPVVEDCKYSTKATRTMPLRKDFVSPCTDSAVPQLASDQACAHV